MLNTLPTAAAASLPNGFSILRVANGLASPTAMQFAPDGRLFVSEQGGRLRVIKNGALLPTPFLTVTVSTTSERGLLGIAFDPDFASNRFVYVYYSATTPAAHNRVSRFTASAANPDVAEPGSEVAILDLENVTAAFHNGGAINFGPDGKLYVAVGEDTVGANAQSLGNRLGKILRINKDGSIPADNPFYTVATGLNRSIWALGLRNPFTFAFNRVGPQIFINDVGQASWEEVNAGAPGANFGWPDTEGATTDPRFTTPRYAYPHTNEACAVTGGTFYSPPNQAFPPDFYQDYFFADYCAGWIRRLDLTTNAVTNFMTDISAIVDMKVSNDGALYVLARGGANAVHRIQYNASLPSITTHPVDRIASPGDAVTFSVRATGAGTLTYQWRRNGANIPGATQPDYTLAPVSLSDNGAIFRALVSNSGGTSFSDQAELTVTTNVAPTATITQPAGGTTYAAGNAFTYAGTGTDPEDGTLPPSAFTWRVDFHHDTHFHPFVPPTTGTRTGAFTIPTVGEIATNVWYRIHLTVRDSGGRTHTTERDIVPRLVSLGLATSPAGLQLRLDGQPVSTPLPFDSVIGMQRNLAAISPQVVGGTTYDFASWSDGGGATHDIAAPAVGTTYVATFRARGELCFDAADNDQDGQIDEECGPNARPPSAPPRLRRLVTGTSVFLEWRSPIAGGSPAGYVLDAGLAAGQTAFSFPMGQATSVLVPNVAPGKYYVRVRAVNAAGSSPSSNEVALTVGCTSMPGPPRLLASQVGGNRVALTWVDDDGCSGTNFRLKVGSAPGMTDLADVPVPTAEFASPAPMGTYHVRVVTAWPSGETPASNEVALTIGSNSCQPPNIAMGLAVQQANRQVTVYWGPLDPNAAVAADALLPLSFALEVGSVPGAANIATFPMGRAVAVTTGAPPGTYYVRVRPVNECGLGPPSNEVLVQVP